MKEYSNDYFDLNRIVSIILVCIPFTAWILGAMTRFMEGKYLAGILRLITGFNIVWILDIILIILQGKILRVIDM